MSEDLALAWASLTDDLAGDTVAARRFFTTYGALLVERAQAATDALERGDAEAARATLLTLTCTSAMAGAHRVRALAAGLLETAGRPGSGADVSRGLAALRRAAREAQSDVDRLLDGQAADPGQPTASNR